MRIFIFISLLVYFVATGAEANTSGVAAKIQGSVMCPVVTPMEKDGNLNLDAISPYAEYLMANGISVIHVLGVYGEGPSLTLTEKKAVVSAWNKYNFTLIVNIGAAAPAEIFEFVNFCEKAGVDAVMSPAPLYYIKQTPEEIVDALQNFTKILPLIYQVLPMRTCVDVSGSDVFSVASKTMPNFLGMQCTIDVALQTIATNVLNSNQVLIVTNYENMKAAYDMHFNASFAPITNVFPCLVNSIRSSVLASQNSTYNNGSSCCANSQTAYDAQIQLKDIIRALFPDSNSTVIAANRLKGKYLPIFFIQHEVKALTNVSDK